MTEEQPNITLLELLREDELDFVVFQDGEEIQVYDEFGDALSAVLDATSLEVGVYQGVGGARRRVELEPSGVIETLLNEAPEDDEVVVSKSTLDTLTNLAELDLIADALEGTDVSKVEDAVQDAQQVLEDDE